MTQRDRIVVGVLAMAAVLAGFWFVLIGPRRDEAASLSQKATEAQTRVDAARARLVTAEAAKRDYGKQLITIARLGKAVPPNEDVPSLVYQLEKTAVNAGIDFRAVKVEPVAGAAAAAAAAAAPAPAPAAGAAGSAGAAAPAPAAGATGAAAAPGSPPVSTLKPMPFKLTFQGEFFDLRKFLDLVHGFAKPKGGTLDVKGRLMTVDGVSLVPGKEGFPQVRAQILATAYTAPADVVGSATAPAAAGGATATPAAGSGTTAQSGQSTGSTPPPAIVGGLLP